MITPGRWIAVALFAVIMSACSVLHAQELSTDVFPSEDELAEALRLGEITYDQYMQLLELARLPIDSTNSYLLDLIPNLSFFGPSDSTLVSGLEAVQADDFGEEWMVGPADRHGRVTHRFYHPLEENGTSGYRTRVNLRPDDLWRADFRLDRELSGRERCTGRSIEYRGKESLRRVVAGNYTARLGLGTAFGYRGKLLDSEDRISGESMACPDYGGYNGAYAEVAGGGARVTVLASLNRDTCHRTEAVAVMVGSTSKHFAPRAIIGLATLENRLTDERLDLPTVSVGVRREQGRSYADVEVNRQERRGGAVWSGVFEGRRLWSEGDLRFAAWAYGDRLIDITAGSKAGALSRTVNVDEVDFKFSDRRAGQEGGLLRTTVQLTDNSQLSTSMLYSGFRRGYDDLQLAAELLREFGPRIRWQADYLGTWKERPSATDAVAQHRWRLENRIALGTLRMRNYIAYTRRSADYDYLSLLTSTRWEAARYGMIEFWSNFGRINATGLRYWYAFLRLEQQWQRRLSTAVKFSHAYNRSSDDRNVAQLSLELNAII